MTSRTKKLIGGIASVGAVVLGLAHEYREYRREQFEQWRYMRALHQQADASATRPITDPVYVEEFLPKDWK